MKVKDKNKEKDGEKKREKRRHALRRTAGTRLIESGAGQPLTAQILGHARINSAGRYFALASDQLRQCCLPLAQFACVKEGLR